MTTSDTVGRKAVPIPRHTAQILDELRAQDSVWHLSLAELLGDEPGSSDAALLSALVSLGTWCVQQRAAEHGYAALAAELAEDTDYQQERSARRQRRAERDARVI